MEPHMPEVLETPEVLIHVGGLRKHFPVRLGAYGGTAATVHAVDRVSLDIFKGETLSLVGESGCGKSTVGFAILQLHRPTEGTVVYKGQDIAQLSDAQLRPLRRDLQIVFQDPYSTLNPRMTVGQTVAEPMKLHRLAGNDTVKQRVAQLLEDVGLPQRFTNRYPHELSGGQRQRVALARALACEPKFLVCDEAVSALDVSVQAQVINLLQDIQQKYQLTYLFIAHDLAVVRHISDRVAVMYLGRLAELGTRDQIFASPQHPYTRALLSSVPHLGHAGSPRAPLRGDVPSPLNPPAGCFFHSRCPMATDECARNVPEWRTLSDGRSVACHYVDGP
jgi:peptide/nickel transport system ATP-binding protein